ncbi:MAG: tRNA preQ1(34) S-adenosylmethionine ribosyltransferase-isomerase QueA [Candidatus Eisenbacteria bacterium]|nr:tRNA preQ1(34) S-adenosylmethionine ribosyltransferase-isomerase QueA [Candidatus Eisenbacteria bacterium]
MKLEDFDYFLPKELIAQKPTPKREESRLLVLDRETGEIEHRRFRDIVRYMTKGDCLVLNETKVIAARVFGTRQDTGKKTELLLVKKLSDKSWTALLKPSKGIRAGAKILVGDGAVIVEVTGRGERGEFEVTSTSDGAIEEIVASHGHVPLPPYIKRPDTEEDRLRYQTVYARKEGSIAAPTAGLHFTQELLDEIRERGVRIAKLILHVGPGTFRPVKTERIEDHVFDEEYFEIEPEAASVINRSISEGGKIVAVGTTVVRALETVAAISSGEKAHRGIEPGSGRTGLFIHTPFEFKLVSSIITNFHLPKSTLLMLVSAFAGRERILDCYKKAVEMKYRFYSYGDAMLIL